MVGCGENDDCCCCSEEDEVVEAIPSSDGIVGTVSSADPLTGVGVLPP